MGEKATQTSQQTQSTSSQSKAEPHPYIQQQLLDNLGRMDAWVGANPTAPNYQIAPRSASLASANNSAWNWGNNMVNNIGATYAPALSALGSTAQGDYLDLSKNPYFQGAMAESLRAPTENFVKNLVPALRSTFASSGRPGSGSENEKLQDAFLNFNRASLGATTTAGNEAYGRERGLQMQASTALPNVYGQMSGQLGGWLDMLRGLGKEDTAANQQQIDVNRANFFVPLDFLTDKANRYLSAFPGGQTTGSGTTMGWGTTGGGGGGFGSALGAGMGLAGLGLQAASLFSDRRDKTDIEELGVDPLTGLKTYAYRYKGDPKNTPKVVGPMAQDIEEVRPDLVREIGGHKVISMPVRRPIDPLTGLPMAA